MTVIAPEQTLLVKSAYPGKNPEECKICGYLLSCSEWSPTAKNGEGAITHFRVCLWKKTGKGIGPVCQTPA